MDLSFHAFSLSGTIEFVFRQRRRVFAAPNIVGVLPGRDPAAGAVLVTAHYDGLGIGAPDARGDTIYNGARDNASGIAGLLVLAEQLARGRRLRRTVIFIATTAEEADFDHVGARYYAEHPVIPLDETVFGLNLDGLAWRAPTRDFLLIPAQTTPAETTITRLAAALDMELSRTSWQNGLNFSFDAEVFLARGVPMVTLWGGSRYRMRDSSATAILTRSSGIHAPHDEFQADWNRPALAQHVELYLTALRHYAGDVPPPGLYTVHPFSDVPVSSGASEETYVERPFHGPLPWRRLGRAIVARLAPAPGELVLFLCRPGRFDDLVPELWYALAERSAIGLGCLDVIGRPYPDDWESGTLSAAWQRTRDATRSWMENADAVIVLPGAWPTEPAYRALQDHLASGRGRAIHFHWDGGRMLDGRDRDVDEVADAMYVRAVLETDHRALAKLQREFEQAARRGPIRVTTPDGTDLTFRVGDRPISRQDGDASRERTRTAQILIDREIEVPAGAVRVAPVEESVHGTIVFPDSYWNGHRVEAPRLEFQSGRVVSISARQGIEYLRAALEQGDGSARRFRAFALGFNPLLAVPDSAPWIPYYGYGAGVVRLSLGANAELGGAVQGNYARWNFFTNATVTVGTEVWVREGRLVRTAR